MALVRGHLSAGTAEARPWDAPCPFPKDREYLALRVDHRLSLVRCPAWTALGVVFVAAVLTFIIPIVIFARGVGREIEEKTD